VLFTALTKLGRYEVRVLSLSTETVEAIPVCGRVARYVPSGHLVFTRTSDVWAVRFDLGSMTTIGEPNRILGGVHVSERGNPFFAVSDAGLLIYEPIRPPTPGRRLVWVDREGGSSDLAEGEGYEFPRISPDDGRVAVAIHSQNGNHSVWTLDSGGAGARSRITFAGNHVQPTWGPDGNRLLYGTFSKDLVWQRLGESKGERLLERRGWQWPLSWVREDLVLFMEHSEKSGWDVLALDPVDETVQPLLCGVANECAATLSPDGRRLAWVSDETGRNEVYLRTYPDGRTKLQVSRDGGTEPVWSPKGGEIFYRHGQTLYSVGVPADPAASVGTPVPLFSGPYVRGFAERPNYDVTSDGRRFVMVEGGWGLTTGRLDVFLHFSAELERRLGGR
jgi:serine/threonine-protein kinase